MADKYIIGLTGNIATGKSTVAQMLEELGAGSKPTLLVLNKADRRTNIRAEDIQASIKYPVSSQLPLDERIATTAANQGVPYMVSEREGVLAQATTALARHIVTTMIEVA